MAAPESSLVDQPEEMTLVGHRFFLWMPEVVRGGVVLFHHRTAFDAFTDRVVARLGAEGYAVAAPELFLGQPDGLSPQERKERLDDAWVLAGVPLATELLRDRGVTPVGAIGFCMGGRLAYLAGAVGGLVDRAVCFYGGDLDVGRRGGPTPLSRVSAASSPMQLHRGVRDSAATEALHAAAVAAADAAGSHLEACTYAGARHAFLNSDDPERFHPEVSARAWARAMAFLAEPLVVTGDW